MEKIVRLDGKPVRLLASAGLPRRFRAAFGRDFYGELAAIEKKSKSLGRKRDAAENPDETDEIEQAETALNTQSLELIENLAFLMARSADPDNIPPNIEDWLDGIADPMAIVNIAGDVLDLYAANTKTTVMPKKKKGRRKGK